MVATHCSIWHQSVSHRPNEFICVCTASNFCRHTCRSIKIIQPTKILLPKKHQLYLVVLLQLETLHCLYNNNKQSALLDSSWMYTCLNEFLKLFFLIMRLNFYLVYRKCRLPQKVPNLCCQIINKKETYLSHNIP